MLVYSVDIGTTNHKVVLYNEELSRLASASRPARYSRVGNYVEFDPEFLFAQLLDMIGECAHQVPRTDDQYAVIALTGQAESLVLADSAGRPMRPGMSWLDGRAAAESVELAAEFGDDDAFAITGQPFPSPTWPAAKLRWLRRHEGATLAGTRHVLMVKDYVAQCFTGVPVGEVSTRGFTYLWNVSQGGYWHEMLDFCGVPEGSLPEVVPAGFDLGPVRTALTDQLPPALGYRINIGALDHFCAMIGTGSYTDGAVSESAGTVLSLSMLASDWSFDVHRKVSFHAGLRPGEVVLFNGADSGGVVLEWFRREGLGNMAHDELEKALKALKALTDREFRSAPIFLPYLTGISPPDFLAAARGAFLGLELGHDRFDMAFAVEEGLAHLLRRNVDYLTPGSVTEIVSTGGGAASGFRNQLKANVCGLDVVVPSEREATCRGAATLALVAGGVLERFEDSTLVSRSAVIRYRPASAEKPDARYRMFENYLERLYGN